MRIIFPLLALASLTACGTAEPTVNDDRAYLVGVYVKQGMTLTDAEQRATQDLANLKEIERDPAIAHRVAQKQAEIDALRVDQCERHPYLSGC